MIKKNARSLNSLLTQVMQTNGLDGKLKEVNLISSWESVVGDMIAKHTTNLYIISKKLVVKLDSAVLRQELSYNKTKIIDMLNEEAGSEIIDKIEFR
ncbi:MAG: DUF721 domain-containing protein [Flavobacteriales bacterium]|nr:DUF721 domain-containing protein [Flavobacteriales bacterium]